VDDQFEQRDQVVTDNGSKVSFCFRNFPEYLPVFRLRQQFKVCGILMDVLLVQQRNSHGQV